MQLTDVRRIDGSLEAMDTGRSVMQKKRRDRMFHETRLSQSVCIDVIECIFLALNLLSSLRLVSILKI